METIDTAFCPLLWSDSEGTRGHCRRPRDCDTCDIMQRVLNDLSRRGVSYQWVCTDCAKKCMDLHKGSTYYSVQLPGFYKEGICQLKDCERNKRTSLLQILTVARVGESP